MRQKSQTRQTGAAKAIKDIRLATRKQYAAEEKKPHSIRRVTW